MFIIIYVTHPDKKSAEKISNLLLEKRYIACANIHNMQSSYWWQGAVQREDEYVSILKTRKENWLIVKSTIEEVHIYDTPCIMKMEVDANEAYVNWIKEMTK